jgi:hypothetical protein
MKKNEENRLVELTPDVISTIPVYCMDSYNQVDFVALKFRVKEVK